ncbi:trypsin-like [Anastrepha ludens]|uniref:trypsin-like n=1 Tax=Anastrepha ludens TaxID=28586 RepID=UPI0023B07972|nr:trypsin-like [Anastrepha ludens]
MYRLLILGALLSSAFTASILDESSGRIVGGEDTSIEAHLYQVSLWLIEEGMHFCGGSRVSEDIVVTAAHCRLGFEPSDMLVRLGSTNSRSGGLLVEVTALKYHEGFNGKTTVNDIAVLRLAQKVTQSESIRFIDLAETVPPTGTQAVVSGWVLNVPVFAY